MAEKKNGKVERARVLSEVRLLVPNDPEALSQWPLFTDLLLPRYDGQTLTRQGAVVKIRAAGTAWLLTIECPTEEVQTALTFATLHDLFAVLEMQLGTGQLHWSETWELQKRRRQARGQ